MLKILISKQVDLSELKQKPVEAFPQFIPKFPCNPGAKPAPASSVAALRSFPLNSQNVSSSVLLRNKFGVSVLHSVRRKPDCPVGHPPFWSSPSTLFWEPRNFQKFGNVASTTHLSPHPSRNLLDFPWWHNFPRHSQGASFPTHPFPRTQIWGPLFAAPCELSAFLR